MDNEQPEPDPAEVEAALKKALEVVRKGWTRSAFARDRNGNGVNESDPSATCWCLAGAFIVACGGCNAVFFSALDDAPPSRGAALYAKLLNLVECRVGITTASWNDDLKRKQSEVIDLLEGLIRDASVSVVAAAPGGLSPIQG